LSNLINTLSELAPEVFEENRIIHLAEIHQELSQLSSRSLGYQNVGRICEEVFGRAPGSDDRREVNREIARLVCISLETHEIEPNGGILRYILMSLGMDPGSIESAIVSVRV